MPGIQFDFVTIGHPGEIKSRQHKRMVHQHVMKEIGLSRRKKKKVTGYNEPVKAVEQETRPQEADGSTGLRLAIAKVDQQRTEAVTVSPGLDVALHLPPKMRAQRMNDFLFRRNSAFCLKVRELCFSLAMFDDGAYCLALAEAALYGDKPAKYLLPHRENAVSLCYYNDSVNHVNQHMRCSKAVSTAGGQAMIGAVLGLASYDVSVGNMQRWQTHMAGLKVLVDGSDSWQVYKSVYFALSLLWTDTTGSLVLDQTPYFTIPLELMQPYHQPVEQPSLAQSLVTLRSLDPQLEDMASILEQLTGLAEAFDLKDTGDSDRYTVYCITRARVSYLLLHVQRADPEAILDESAPMNSVLRETIRLAALVFLLLLVGFVPSTGSGPGSMMPHHAARLGTLLVRHDWLWTGMAELQLWVLALTAVATDDPLHRTWLVSRMEVFMKEAGIPWSGLAGVLKQVAWAEGLLDDQLRELEALKSK